MRVKLRIPTSAWTLGDQGVVSLGTFAVNMVLARDLTPDQYGTFSLIFLSIMGLSTITNAVLFYPLSVRATVTSDADRSEVFGAGLLLTFLGCAPLCVVLAIGLLLLGCADVAVSVVAWFVLRQAQELFRRALFSEMRHAAAVPGDMICYLGQALVLFLLARSNELTIDHAILSMAGMSAEAAVLQATQVSIRFGPTSALWRFAHDWLGLGAGSLGIQLLATLRTQFFPWALAAVSGPAAAANYQAASNLVQLCNPLIIGLCNVIPQMSARGLTARDYKHAWKVAQPLMILGAAPLLACYVLLGALPSTVLAIFYGAGSAYTHLGTVVQALTLSAVLTYPVEMVLTYLHGIAKTPLGVRINFVGLIASVVLGLPLTVTFGLAGSCVALLGSVACAP